jgi:hypothetical protein
VRVTGSYGGFFLGQTRLDLRLLGHPQEGESSPTSQQQHEHDPAQNQSQDKADGPAGRFIRLARPLITWHSHLHSRAKSPSFAGSDYAALSHLACAALAPA